jgi:uncharacterized protein YuzE
VSSISEQASHIGFKKVYYDKRVYALYIKLGTKAPDGVVEISEGVNLDTTSEGKIVGSVTAWSFHEHISRW